MNFANNDVQLNYGRSEITVLSTGFKSSRQCLQDRRNKIKNCVVRVKVSTFAGTMQQANSSKSQICSTVPMLQEGTRALYYWADQLAQ